MNICQTPNKADRPLKRVYRHVSSRIVIPFPIYAQLLGMKPRLIMKRCHVLVVLGLWLFITRWRSLKTILKKCSRVLDIGK